MDNATENTSLPQDAVISALKSQLLPIVLIAVIAGGVAFATSYFTSPRIEVIGYVEIARLEYVDPDGKSSEVPTMPAPVLAGQVNSGAFFGAGAGPGRPRIVARVPVKTENLELRVRVARAADGVQAIRGIVSRMAAAHRKQQQPQLDRLGKRYAALTKELDALRTARSRFDARLAEIPEVQLRKDDLAFFILTSLRAQNDKEIRDLERRQQGVKDAMDMMQERQTRLIGNIIIGRASKIPSILLGMFAAVLAGLLAVAVVALGASRRSRSRG